MLSLDELRGEAQAGSIDTVVAAFTDMQGRLMGKRIDASFFLEDVAQHGIEGCNYLLALDMEMDPVPGYDLANWEKGYGDFAITPDLATLRRIPWLDRTALVLCDVRNHDGSPFTPSPRQVLIAQYERAQRMGYTPMFASELEFYLYKQSYAEAHERDYSGLTPTIPYILDYHILATTMDEGVIGQIRRGMQAAGIPVEFSKGEAWQGQHELNFRYADAVTSADRHTVYKNGVKEIAFLNGISATFMAKPSEKDIGSSCHIHTSLVTPDGRNAFVDGHEETELFHHFLGGMRGRVRELALLIAPSINSYKRYATESWAPTSISWGRDNRTCGFRIVGHGQSRRAECRIPGADVNPYLGYAALLAAGLDGIERGTDPGPELVGNAYEAADAEPFPASMREAIALWEEREFARATFGEEVWRHYLNYGRTEQRLFDEVVTDYERRRMFERG
ncbi:MAG: glutamine synthetase [Solirubrobacterales bacterium]|nr:glutamine synthetase [Solirubrobacterales bacterium]MBV9536615.1 glutamine synthetase [Solirubrobacterales bacterium]